MQNHTDPNHNHQHDHGHSHSNPFAFSFYLILLFALIELAGGIFTHSLALLGDAWHMFSDVAALGLAWYASHKASKSGGVSHAELIASMISVVLMLVVIAWIVLESIDRLKNPQNVAGGMVMVIAFIGLIINMIVAKNLHQHTNHQAHHHGKNDNLNHRAALLHVLGDLLGSIAALAAGAIIYFTGWLAADPILSLLICALLLFVTLSLAKDIWHTVKHSF